MKKTRIFALLTALLLAVQVLCPHSLIPGVRAEESNASNQSGMVLDKTATMNEDGSVQITLEAYATGNKVISTVNRDVPTDIVLVIDQSSSMAKCIVCGEDIGRDSKHEATVYTATTNVSTNGSYYIKNGNDYIKVAYCSGTHGSLIFSTACAGGAGWYIANGTAGDHTAAAKITPKTSDNSNGTQFYTQSVTRESCTSRLSALNTAVGTFVDAVTEKAKGEDGQFGTADDVNHRIAVVGFATGEKTENSREYPQYGNTELFIGAQQYSYTSASRYYGQAFQNMNTQTGYNNVVASKNALAASGATCVDLGIEMANGIFNANSIAADETRNRVMIVFTDGAPSEWSSYSQTVAQNAINNARVTKNTHHATVYSIGIFDGADATSAGNQYGSDTQKANWFMQNVSSNNGTVQNPSYYLSAGDTDALNQIFQQISDQIESGGSSTTLSAETVLRDLIAPQFQLPNGATAADISLESYHCTGRSAEGYTWTQNASALGAVASVDASGSVSVSGFDFADHYVGTVTENGTTAYRGDKLVIRFNVQPREGFLGGNDVYTNTAAGVYENSSASEPILTFPRPSVNVEIDPLTAEAADYHVYLLGSLSAQQLRSGVQLACGDVTLNLNEENFGLEPWQNAYVDIIVQILDAAGKPVQDLTDLRDDTTYSMQAVVSPRTTTPASAEGTPAVARSAESTGSISVFRPVMTWQDCTVYYGDLAPENDQTRLFGTQWMHGETYSDLVEMTGDVPTLSTAFAPQEGAIVDGRIATKQDIPVRATVRIDGTDVTADTCFLHQTCAEFSCVAPQDAAFWLHVKTCKLTVEKKNGADDEPYLFRVYKDGQPYTELTITGNDSVTISELPVGVYRVEEDLSWSWRYTCSYDLAEVALSAQNPEAAVVCTNTLTNDHWLNGFTSVVTNTFGQID